ncbi:RNA polymerase sigma factor [Paenibacillus sp. GYB003]|uniref:RNA polymerase sigma factor n=1 Tax=Paenibacillus sp. GYB003 TaxID=2994392 RepID=UPI002F9662A7
MERENCGRMPVRADTDAALVAMARVGDSDAFDELAKRHRDSMYGWAFAVVRDPHLAEDVVQEAIMKSFLQLGALVDMSRFLPWLRTIVRHEAYRSVRKHGRLGKERPLSGFDRSVWPLDADSAWPAMTPSAVSASGHNDPCELLLRRETLETIEAMCRRLKPAERRIFEAHICRELSAREISERLQVSTASVYMSLSRSRKKLRAGLAPAGGKEIAMTPKRKTVLPKPGMLYSRTGLYNESIRNCMYYALPYIGKGHLPYDEAMALTGHAFQINIERRTINLSGVYMYAGTTMFPNSMLNLGHHSSVIDKFGYERMPDGPVKDELYRMLLDMIRQSIDRGVPAVFGSVENKQFALYYGYDDERELFYAVDTLAEMEVPYETYRNRHLYGFVIEEAVRQDDDEPFRRMLAMAVKHGRGAEATFTGIVNGLPAYDAWIEAFERRTVDAAGNAASLRNVGDMRGYATSFLSRKAGESEFDASANRKTALREAAACYRTVAACFRRLQALFPYPGGGSPHDPDAASSAISLLSRARESEAAGLHALERLLQEMNGARESPLLLEPVPFWVL